MKLKPREKNSEASSIVVRRAVRNHILNLIVTGVVLTLLLFLLALGVLVNDGLLALSLRPAQDSRDAVNKYLTLVPQIRNDLSTRFENIGTSSSQASGNPSWDSALDSLLPFLPSSMLPLIDQRVTAFASAATKGLLLFTYVDLIVAIGAAVSIALNDADASTSLFQSGPILALSSAQGALGSLFSRMSYLVSKGTRYSVFPQDGIGLMLQYATALAAPLFSTSGMTLAKEYQNYVEEGQKLIQTIVGFSKDGSTATVPFSSMDELNNTLSILQNSMDDGVHSTLQTKDQLIFDAIGAFLSLIAFLLCTFLIRLYLHRTSQVRELVNAFEDPKVREMVYREYLPVIISLQAVRQPEVRTNELTRVFSIAACWSDLVRTVTPQLLFGRGRKRGEDWSLLEEKVNLRIHKPRYCPHVVAVEVTVVVHSREEVYFYERKLTEQMEMLNEVYGIVVGEANRAGGVVAGVRGNISILALWNTLWTPKNAELLALRTAMRIQDRLQKVPGLPRVMIGIASGPAVMGGVEVGTRKCASTLGTVLSYLDAVRATGLAIGCNMVVDRPTNRRLPRAVAHLLKPLVVLRVQTPSGPSSCVVYTIDEMETVVNEAHRSQYMKGFSLYQNNLFNEATLAYERYLSQCPSDRVARWVYEFVVAPKFRLGLAVAAHQKAEEVEKNAPKISVGGEHADASAFF